MGGEEEREVGGGGLRVTVPCDIGGYIGGVDCGGLGLVRGGWVEGGGTGGLEVVLVGSECE